MASSLGTALLPARICHGAVTAALHLLPSNWTYRTPALPHVHAHEEAMYCKAQGLAFLMVSWKGLGTQLEWLTGREVNVSLAEPRAKKRQEMGKS